MSDLDRFVALYASFGITCVVNATDAGYDIQLSAEDYPDPARTFSDKFDGYHGFYTKVIFDKDGRFVGQGFWE